MTVAESSVNHHLFVPFEMAQYQLCLFVPTQSAQFPAEQGATLPEDVGVGACTCKNQC